MNALLSLRYWRGWGGGRQLQIEGDGELAAQVVNVKEIHLRLHHYHHLSIVTVHAAAVLVASKIELNPERK